MIGKLYISRHAESEWNALGKWTGITDVHLSDNGYQQALQLGEALKGVRLHQAYCSEQIRTYETLKNILDASENIETPYDRVIDLNERDYGDFTGMNKWEVRDKVGEVEFNSIRRDWDHPVPNGETLKMVFERAVPFFQQAILPRLLAGHNILIVAHGNSIRALIKFIEDISDEGVAHVEMPLGTIVEYTLSEAGKKQVRNDITIELAPSKA